MTPNARTLKQTTNLYPTYGHVLLTRVFQGILQASCLSGSPGREMQESIRRYKIKTLTGLLTLLSHSRNTVQSRDRVRAALCWCE
jgi:hypothetical protein